MLWRPRYTPAAKCHEWTRLIADFVGVKGEALRHVREAAELLEDAADATTVGGPTPVDWRADMADLARDLRFNRS